MSYRFGQAAKAIGVTEAALRNWMTRNQLDLFDERPANGWRSFSENDVMVLALAAKLVAFGASVDDAVRATTDALANVNFRNMDGLPYYYWAAPSRLGGWFLCDKEELVLSEAVDGGDAAVRIAPIRVLSAALKRLRGEA